MLPAFAYLRADSLQNALEGVTAPDDHFMAGGTDLLGCMREHLFPVRKVVSISRLPELARIRETMDKGLRIGALATISEVADNSLVNERYPGLATGALEVASPQLRNQGTIGGNLCQKPRCWYYRGEFDCLRKGGDRCFAVGGQNQFHCIFGGSGCFIVHPSDTLPNLCALGARVEIRSRSGKRTVAADEFIMDPAEDPTRETVLDNEEIVTAVVLPRPGRGLYSSYRKVRARRSWDFALVSVALALELEDGRVRKARLFAGGVAPYPWRIREAEQEITGRTLDRAVAGKAAAAAVKSAQPLSRNEYKIHMLRNVLREELLQAR